MRTQPTFVLLLEKHDSVTGNHFTAKLDVDGAGRFHELGQRVLLRARHEELSDAKTETTDRRK